MKAKAGTKANRAAKSPSKVKKPSCELDDAELAGVSGGTRAKHPPSVKISEIVVTKSTDSASSSLF
jgi:hypothetical protein